MRTLIVVACLAIAGCSSPDGTTARDRTTSGTGGKAAIKPSGNAGSGGAGNFGNSNAPVQQPMNSLPVIDAGSSPVVGGGLQPISIDACGANNTASLSPADAAALIAGSGSADGMRWLYPYDGTVFPRGLLAPLLMWEGGAADAVYVHIKAEFFEYRGCLKPTADGQLRLPDDIWATAGVQTKGSAEPYLLEISVLQGGVAKGPIAEHFTIAQATIKGSIYYNSYSSMLGGPNAMGGFGGGAGGMVLRIPPGGTAEVFSSMECNGCHSVSANGSRLISQAIMAGESFALSPTTAPNSPSMMTGQRSAFGALYPDGSAFLSTSAVIEVARASMASGTGGPFGGGSTDATLYRTDDGTVIPNTGIPVGALMPMISPSGTLLAFNDYAINEAHGLVVMDYDTTLHAATNPRTLFTDSDLRPGWPFVLPDNGGVVFTRTDGTDFSGDGAGIGGTTTGPVSDLYIADVKTSTVTLLARAMGYDTPDDAAAGKTYLPFGAEELKKSYFPTVSPVAAGGYFWLFFDAVRHYGNLGSQRQLWGAAIEISADGDYSIDRSRPAFYLPGQEFGTGNHRAFAALDPCKQNGDTCTSGTDCCGGFCYVKDSGDDEFGSEPVGSCTADVPKCSNTNERCATSADCCPPPDGQPANSCIAGFCAMVEEGPS